MGPPRGKSGANLGHVPGFLLVTVDKFWQYNIDKAMSL
jgi:hypothetical protein